MKEVNSPLRYKIIIVTIMSMVILIATLYLLWSQLMVTNNQEALDQQIESNLYSYQQQIEKYLIQKNNIVNQAIIDTTNEYPVFSVDTFKRSLAEKIALGSIEPTKFSVLSKSELDNGFWPQISNSFLTIDMLNRLQANEPIFWEAAKKPGVAEWELNKLFPIVQNNRLLGIVFISLPLDGLYALFSENELEGRITISQSVGVENPLVFFSVGRIEDEILGKTRPISDSYWKINYKSSITGEKSQSKTTTWLLLASFLLFLLMLLISYFLIKRPYPASLPSTTDKKNLKSINEKRSLSKREEIPEDIPIDHIIFRAYDIRGIVGKQLSKNIFYVIGKVFATEAIAAGETTLLVGHDSRTHSPELAESLIEGIVSTGCNSIDIGLAPTPLLNFTAIQHTGTTSGIVVTASHNPKEYNGCKMIINGSTLVDENIQRLKQRIDEKDWITAPIQGKKTTENFTQEYINFITNDLVMVDGWKVVIDAANGAAGQLAKDLFVRLQCQLTPLYCDPDGQFPHHDPDPSVEKNLQDLIKKVKEEKADIGFAFDGDGDRLVAVTQQGHIVWPDQLLMIFAQDIVARNPGCDVVFDVKSSAILSPLIAKYGGRPIMCKTGHSHIKAKMKETGALLGGEFSGHLFFKERWFGFDDGLYAASRLLEIMTLTGQNLDKLLSDLPKKISTPEIKIPMSEENKFTFINQLKNHNDVLKIDGDVTRVDGLRIDFETSWGLVRASNTAPFLTLRFEADNAEELRSIKNYFKNLLNKIDKDLLLDF